MKTAIYTYPWDYLDEGSDAILDRFQDIGVDGVYVAVKYHTAQMLLPHNPKRKIYFPTPGAVYFRPDLKIYKTSMVKPILSPIIEDYDFNVLEVLRSKTLNRNMGLYAWILAYHSTAFGEIYPSLSITNVFGDKLLHSQCPSNPDATEYLLNMVNDITANYSIDKILLESIESSGIYHGFHHEMNGVPLNPFIAFLLGLCFCQHCIKNAGKRNIDVDSLKIFVKDSINDYFLKDYNLEKLEWSFIRDMANGEMGRYLDMRQDINVLVHREVKKTIRKNSNCEISIVDFGPLKYFYYLGSDMNAWENGVNFKRIKDYVDSIVPLFYRDNLDDFEQRYNEFLKMIDDNTKIGIALLPLIMPGSEGLKDLKQYLRDAVNIFKNKSKVDEISFYNYSLMNLSTLDLIKNVME